MELQPWPATMPEILSAKLYFDQHGDQAAIPSNALLEVGDMDGAAM